MSERVIVVIDPVKKAIHKIYNSKQEVIDDLGITRSTLNGRLRGTKNPMLVTYPWCCIIKYQDEVTPENIQKWIEGCNYGLNNEQRCTKCGEWKDKSEFVQQYCRPCHRKRHVEYKSTEKGFFITIASAIKSTAKRRGKKGRTDAGICTIDTDFLMKLFHEQKGLCHYSGLPMVTKPLSNWQVSCERLNNALGYIPSNVKLVCLEFNTGNGQWSREKVEQIKKLIRKRVNINQLKQLTDEAKEKPISNVVQKKRNPSIINDGVELLHCTNCDEYLDKSNFCKDGQTLSSKCRDCIKVRSDAYY